MDKDVFFLTTAVLPLAIKYIVVAKWRSPADGVAGLGGLTVQAHYLSGYSHYPPPQPPAQLSDICISGFVAPAVEVSDICISGFVAPTTEFVATIKIEFGNDVSVLLLIKIMDCLLPA